MQERRRYVRIPENSQISYEVIPSEKTKEHSTKDLSQGGIRFFLQEFIPRDTHLKIKLNLRKTLFNLEALVRIAWISQVPHTQNYEAGVEFLNIPPKAVEYLKDYIRVFLNAQHGRDRSLS